jgi:hypothetical protein
MASEKITQKGFWWLPQRPQNRLAGDITYSLSDGAEISLLGTLAPLERLAHVPEPNVVWGTTVSNKNITLFRAYQTNAQLNMPGITTSRMESFRGVVGNHYNGEDDVIVRSVTCDVDYLTQWTSQTAITQTFDPPPSRTARLAITVPENINLGRRNGVEITIVPLVHQNHSAEGVVLREFCRLQLKPDEPQRFQLLEPLINSVQKFLSLAVGEPCRALDLHATIPDEDFVFEGKQIWKKIELFQKVRQVAALEKIHREQMLFSLPDLLPNANKVFQSFLDVEQRLSAVFDLFFPTVFFPEMPPPQVFLNLAHSIEAFHRATIGGEYQTAAEYRNGLEQIFRRAIPADIGAEFRQSLQNKLQYLHEYSLRKRLKDVLRRFDGLVNPYVGEYESFINRAAEARNRLVHASADRPPPDYSELWNLAQQLGMILEIAILNAIGFEPERIRAVTARGKRAALIRNNIPV